MIYGSSTSIIRQYQSKEVGLPEYLLLNSSPGFWGKYLWSFYRFSPGNLADKS